MPQSSLPLGSIHSARSLSVGVFATGSCELEKPVIVPLAEVVLNHASTVKLSGFVYCTVVSAQPVEPSVVTA